MKVFYGNEPKKEESKYPYFGLVKADDGINDFVVLFFKFRTGIVVKTDAPAVQMYKYSEMWCESDFQKLDKFSVTFSVP